MKEYGEIPELIKYFPEAEIIEKLLYSFYIERSISRQELETQLRESAYISSVNRNQSGINYKGAEKETDKIYGLKVPFFANVGIRNPLQDNQHEISGRLPYHRHNFIELVYVSKGQFAQYISGRRCILKSGDVCVLNPNVLHQDCVAGREDEVIFLCISSEFLAGEIIDNFKRHDEIYRFFQTCIKFSTTNQQYCIFRCKDQVTEMPFLVNQILKENFLKQKGHHLIMKGLFVRMISVLLEQYELEAVCESKETVDNRLMLEITQYLKEHMQTVKRQEAAGCFFFNPDYFSRFIKKHTGRSYEEYMRDLRMEAAAKRLKAEKTSVNKIIKEVGFENKSYFYKIFHEQYGMNPVAYRNTFMESQV